MSKIILVLTALVAIAALRRALFNSVKIQQLEGKIMSQENQIADLDSATTDLTAAIADEKAQVAQAISTLNDTVANLQAAVPPEVDLSKEINDVKAAADAVRAIYTPPAAPANDGTPVPITADPVADDTSTEVAPTSEVTPDSSAATPDAVSGE
jgi:septal ring factor EnvC (AmiA/AmiB activator)